MKYPGYKRYTREELIEKYNMTEDDQTYFLEELLAIEEDVYNRVMKERAEEQ